MKLVSYGRNALKKIVPLLFEYSSFNHSLTFFGRLELWWHPGEWRQLSKWEFDYQKYIGCQCRQASIAFLGITLLSRECVGIGK